MHLSFKSVSLFALLSPLAFLPAAADPVLRIDKDFPDPSLTEDPKSGNWYAFATAGNGHRLQVAKAGSPIGPWEWLDIEILPKVGSWAVDTGVWAPDVRYLGPSNSFVLYYAAPLVADNRLHCVGAATAENIEGPYTPQDDYLACPQIGGGAIDPAGYYDSESNSRWIVYKVDGNALNPGGSCGNANEPIVPTPIFLQQVEDDGYTGIGQAIKILDRDDADGPLVEAPSLVRAADGTYILFFSSNCYNTDLYDISYATASDVRGPYTKAKEPLLVTGDFDLTSPGGAAADTYHVDSFGGNLLTFHANCGSGRCMYQSAFAVSNNVVTIVNK